MELVLSLLRDDVPRPRDVLLGPGGYVFGRDPRCDLRLDHRCVSRRHCFLHVGADAAHVFDLDSHNGTFVNGARVEAKARLSHGAWLEIDEYLFQVHLDPLPPAVTLATAMSAGPWVIPDRLRRSRPDDTDDSYRTLLLTRLVD